VAAEDLAVAPGLLIPAAELEERFSTSGGPGGQHANRARTRVELRFDVAGSAALTERQRALLRERVGDEVVVVAEDERSQSRNRALARERLAARLRAGLAPRRARRPTRPTAASRRRRLEAKRRRAEIKRSRRPPRDD